MLAARCRFHGIGRLGLLDFRSWQHEADIQCNDEFLWMPEALRIKGEILFSSDRADANLAEEHFRRSLDIANRQGALSWELRSAMSLGRLYHVQGRILQS